MSKIDTTAGFEIERQVRFIPVAVTLTTNLAERFDEAALARPTAGQPMWPVVVDFAGVQTFDCDFLEQLLRWSRTLDRAGCHMALCGVEPPARVLLRLAALDGLWPVYADRPAAIAALGGDDRTA